MNKDKLDIFGEEVFNEGVSATDALYNFARADINSYELERDISNPDIKKLIRKLRRNGIAKFRMLARRWCTKQGYDWKN